MPNHPNYPLKMRYKDRNGTFGARVVAEDPKQVIDYLAQWREAGFTAFEIVDATGQPVRVVDLMA